MTSSQPDHPLTLETSDRFLSAYDYELPQDYIAQCPVSPRDSSRLLVVTTPTHHQHHIFRDLPTLLRPGDLLVLNNTRVIPARLFGQKPSGSPAEILLVEELERNRWLALVKPGRRLKPGATIELSLPSGDGDLAGDSMASTIVATMVETDPSIHGRVIEFTVPGGKDLWDVLPQLGHVPLPPYVTETGVDSDRYQTVFSQEPGAIAAPTAGLHFTPELLAHLEQIGIPHCFITLHVGVGTFRPVEVEDITTHAMHQEWIDIPEPTVERIRMTQEQGGRIIAVGTTVTRALESAGRNGQDRKSVV